MMIKRETGEIYQLMNGSEPRDGHGDMASAPRHFVPESPEPETAMPRPARIDFIKGIIHNRSAAKMKANQCSASFIQFILS